MNKYPKLRSHTRRRKSGKVVTYYFYDRRPEPDIPLGSDYDQAVKRWDEIHNKAPRIAGTLMEAFKKFEEEVLPGYKTVTRNGYGWSLARLKPAFGTATWDATKLQHLAKYLEKRKAKTQANREMSLLSLTWNRARLWGMTDLPFPAAGMERSKWKNAEKPREVEVTDELFSAIYAQADQTVRDCMDLATATGMRLTDCRTIPMPRGTVLSLRASKTGKAADFDIEQSPVLQTLVERRKTSKATHTMLLTSKTGKQVSARMLRDGWDEARSKAAEKAAQAGDTALAAAIRKLYLRDMRKRAADLAPDLDGASELLQHSSKRVTQIHYRSKAPKVRPVR